MERSPFSGLLVLFLLKCVEVWRNYYKLNAILVRKFNVINLHEIDKELTKEGLITMRIENSLTYYEITNSGIEYVNQNYDKLISKLYEEYPNEKEFIDILISKVPDDNN